VPAEDVERQLPKLAWNVVGCLMPFQRILCAVDFSPESSEAFRVGVEMARNQSALLHVFHVIEAPPVVADWMPGDGMAEMMLRLESKAQAAMESLARSVGSALRGLSVTSEITSGRAFIEITNRAREWSADLIVLGSRGAALFEEIIVGSTAERVMKQAPCSVLIARLPRT
jgi:nucleotide-binding universal stress UspA family protein